MSEMRNPGSPLSQDYDSHALLMDERKRLLEEWTALALKRGTQDVGVIRLADQITNGNGKTLINAFENSKADVAAANEPSPTSKIVRGPLNPMNWFRSRTGS